LKQVAAEIIKKSQILKELERPYARTSKRPQARNISGSWIIWLRCPDIAREAQPGQFVMVRCGEGSECLLRRPLSIHQVNDEGDMAICFAVWEDGKGTKWLSQRNKGDTVDLFGPLGNGFSIHPASHNLLLVAGGIGIAPLRFLADQALSHKYSVKLLLGASGEFKPSGQPNPPQLYPKYLLPHGIELETITSSRDGLTNMVTDLLPNSIDWADQIFACGPMPMYRVMSTQYQHLFKAKSVQTSLEVRMGCGLGVCYSCTLKTKNGLKQVCKDGPVFNLDDILWDEQDFT